MMHKVYNKPEKTKKEILKMSVDVTDIERVLLDLDSLANNKGGAYVCVSNVHMCMETYDCDKFLRVVNSADLVVPDGKPLSIVQKLTGHSSAKQVRGQDLFEEICKKSNSNGRKIGLYGGSSNDVLELVRLRLLDKYPKLDIAYAFSPPFRELTKEESEKVIADINLSAVDFLFVGIGCPKQEFWMAEHKDKLNCVMLGVGAAFDFISGCKKHAPRWMQKLGLEWLFRLCSEPRRLWKRYLKHNPRFIYHVSKQIVKERLF